MTNLLINSKRSGGANAPVFGVSPTAATDDDEAGVTAVVIGALLADITDISFDYNRNAVAVGVDSLSFSIDDTVIASGDGTWTRTTEAGWIRLDANVIINSQDDDLTVALYEHADNTCMVIHSGRKGTGELGRLANVSVSFDNPKQIAVEAHRAIDGQVQTGASGTVPGLSNADVVAGSLGVADSRDFNDRYDVSFYTSLTSSSGGWTHSTDGAWDLLEQSFTWVAAFDFDIRTKNDGADMDWQIDGVHSGNTNGFTACSSFYLFSEI